MAPEDDPVAVRDYRDHMRIIGHVTRRGARVNVALHAGELTPSLVALEVTDEHIRLAVEVAWARRIGHGTDIAWERDARGTLGMMAARGVARDERAGEGAVAAGGRAAALGSDVVSGGQRASALLSPRRLRKSASRER